MAVQDNTRYMAVCSECETAFLQSSVIIKTVKVSNGTIAYCECPNCKTIAVLDTVPTISFVSYNEIDRDDQFINIQTELIKTLGESNGI